MFFFLLVVRFSVHTEDSHRKHVKLDVAIQEGEVPKTSMQHSQADYFIFYVFSSVSCVTSPRLDKLLHT